MQLTQRPLQRAWIGALMFALAGYALLGKGFAYLFLGEMVLVVGFCLFLQSKRIMLVFSDSVLLLWAIFALWGFCRTVPFVSKYGIDAVRDAVIWGYGVFAVLIAAFVNNSAQISHLLNRYRKFLRWYLPILPFLLLASIQFKSILPSLPWGDGITIVMLRSGESAVHLAAAALFLLIFPMAGKRSKQRDISIFHWIGVAGWVIAALIIFVNSRGGTVAIAIPIIVASIFETRKIGWKIGTLAIVGIIAAFLALEANPFDLHVKGITVTPDNVTKIIGSIAGGDAAPGHEGTKEFRLVWWKHIIDYTIFGPYRWTGKGFGVNLAVVDGPPGMTAEESSLRSPHNGNMSILARMGVPGIVIWAAMNFAFVFRLIKAYRRANRSGSRFWSGVNLWILCYWLGSFVNMSFDVYLEGPQGGIWFWSIIGMGVAALRVQAYEARQAKRKSRLRGGEIYGSIAQPSLQGLEVS